VWTFVVVVLDESTVEREPGVFLVVGPEPLFNLPLRGASTDASGSTGCGRFFVIIDATYALGIC
jgi:hypothetical protein